MIYDNGTMDVRVNGQIERRRYSINCEAPFTNRYLDRMQTKYQPELRDGEEAFFSLGDDIPTIVETGHRTNNFDAIGTPFPGTLDGLY